MVEGLKERQLDGHILYCFHYVTVMEIGAQLCLVLVYPPDPAGKMQSGLP